MSGDEIMQGFVISTFVLCGISSIVYCIRLRIRDARMGMKQSPSMEDLNSVDTQDPEQAV